MSKNTDNQEISTSSCWIDEYHEGVRYGLEGQVLIDEQSSFQQITIVDSIRYGKALLLDGCWMTSEQQDKHYHECLVHPAMSSSKEIEKVLIVGGGDGGAARESLQYDHVKQLDLVEIDRRVIELSREYLKDIGNGAWEDSRLKINIENGIDWVKDKETNSYDVVLIDSSDPTGPAKGLFDKEFYENCKRILRPGGVFGTQSESPESFQTVHIDIVKVIREVFNYADPLYGCVPMYPSGWWSWTFASMDKNRYKNPKEVRSKILAPVCEIWSTKWQEGAFKAMPAFIETKLTK